MSDDFVSLYKNLRIYIVSVTTQAGPATALQTVVPGKNFHEILTEVVSRTDEKMQVGDYVRFNLGGPGIIGIYVHFNKKVGSMVQIETDSDKTAQSPAIKTAAADFAMHITASKPIALDAASVDPVTVEKEKAIYADQVKGKPAGVVDKIVQGKLSKFYSDYCLVLQPFVKDDTKTVEQVLAEAAKQAGGKATIKQFVRFEVG